LDAANATEQNASSSAATRIIERNFFIFLSPFMEPVV